MRSERGWLVAALALLGAASASAQTGGSMETAAASDAAGVERPALREKLLAMRETDQRLRRALSQSREVKEEDGKFVFSGESKRALERLQEADRRHTERLKAIVAEHGWPTISMVGEDGSQAAWLLVQHATHDLAFMERALNLMTPLVDAGEVAGRNYAYLFDRVQMHNDRPQRYGTQFTSFVIDGVKRTGPWPMENPERVDELRRSVGLGPFQQYAENLMEDDPPLPPGMSIEDIRRAQRGRRGGESQDSGR